MYTRRDPIKDLQMYKRDKVESVFFLFSGPKEHPLPQCRMLTQMTSKQSLSLSDLRFNKCFITVATFCFSHTIYYILYCHLFYLTVYGLPVGTNQETEI